VYGLNFRVPSHRSFAVWHPTLHALPWCVPVYAIRRENYSTATARKTRHTSGGGVLENNIVQTGGSVGAVLFSVPLRRTLIVDQDLAFPEGKAAAEVLKAGENPSQGIRILGGAALAGGPQWLGVIVLAVLAMLLYRTATEADQRARGG
jgi:uncharacterized oligopeptide transporter (OPT) family protein